MFSDHSCSILHTQINVIERQKNKICLTSMIWCEAHSWKSERAHVLSSVECCQDVVCTGAGSGHELLRVDARLDCVHAEDSFPWWLVVDAYDASVLWVLALIYTLWERTGEIGRE